MTDAFIDLVAILSGLGVYYALQIALNDTVTSEFAQGWVTAALVCFCSDILTVARKGRN